MRVHMKNVRIRCAYGPYTAKICVWAVTQGGGGGREREDTEMTEVGPTLLALLVKDLKNGIAAAA